MKPKSIPRILLTGLTRRLNSCFELPVAPLFLIHTVIRIIERKKAGYKLTPHEIERVVRGATTGEIPDYQTSAFLMAVCWRGMDVEERAHLTRAMADSGERFDFSSVKGRKIDKHSTGGVGDKTSLILAPWLALAGLKVPMISGRGLGFTGGTLDKLASIPGYTTDISKAQAVDLLDSVGCFIIGQSAQIAPADKKIYALRDVTATVDEISLITASILSKKFCENLDALVMDIKCGSGSFMQSFSDARALAQSIADTANSAGVRTNCLVTAMDFPLGRYTGNTVEVFEAHEFCNPSGVYRRAAEKVYETNEALSHDEALVGSLVEITIELAIAMLADDARENAQREEARRELFSIWKNGALARKFSEWIAAQQGDESAFLKKARAISAAFGEAPNDVVVFTSHMDGYFNFCDARAIGQLMVELGAGRKTATDTVDDRVSLEMCKAPYASVQANEALLRIYKPNLTENDRAKILAACDNALRVGEHADRRPSNILARI